MVKNKRDKQIKIAHLAGIKWFRLNEAYQYSSSLKTWLVIDYQQLTQFLTIFSQINRTV